MYCLVSILPSHLCFRRDRRCGSVGHFIGAGKRKIGFATSRQICGGKAFCSAASLGEERDEREPHFFTPSCRTSSDTPLSKTDRPSLVTNNHTSYYTNKHATKDDEEEHIQNQRDYKNHDVWCSGRERLSCFCAELCACVRARHKCVELWKHRYVPCRSLHQCAR